MITDTKKLAADMLAEIDMIEPGSFNPQNDLDKDETKLFDVDDDYIKRLYALWMYNEREYKRIAVELQFEKDDRVKFADGQRAYQKSDLYERLFWIILRERYDLWHEDGVGVRKNFVVVRTSTRTQRRLRSKNCSGNSSRTCGKIRSN